MFSLGWKDFSFIEPIATRASSKRQASFALTLLAPPLAEKSPPGARTPYLASPLGQANACVTVLRRRWLDVLVRQRWEF